MKPTVTYCTTIQSQFNPGSLDVGYRVDPANASSKQSAAAVDTGADHAGNAPAVPFKGATCKSVETGMQWKEWVGAVGGYVREGAVLARAPCAYARVPHALITCGPHREAVVRNACA